MSDSSFNQIDLNALPEPEAIKELSFDDILAESNAQFATENPDLAGAIDFESGPISALQQAWAYREVNIRKYANNILRAALLARSWGNNLDHLAAIVPLARNEGEKDDDFRQRIQFAPEGFSVAGPKSAYIFHLLGFNEHIKDVFVESPDRGVVNCYIFDERGVLSENDIGQIEAYMQDKRPFTDNDNYLSFQPYEFDLTARIKITIGLDKDLVLAAAKDAALAYISTRQSFGGTVYRSGLIAALTVPGVENVTLETPIDDVTGGLGEIVFAANINVTEQDNG